jgi:hypothetical protein
MAESDDAPPARLGCPRAIARSGVEGTGKGVNLTSPATRFATPRFYIAERARLLTHVPENRWADVEWFDEE